MKFKKIPDEYFSVILDRLMRFEPACCRYERVFNDIISKFAFDIKGIKNKDDFDTVDKIKLVEKILEYTFENNSNDSFISQILKQLEDISFNSNTLSNLYLSSKISYKNMFDKIHNGNNLPNNFKLLDSILKNDNLNDIYKLRKEQGFLFPIEKIILCEGQTEYVLLNTIFKILGYDLDKEGILIIQAGGKNQVAKKYYEMLEYVKLPFFILLDKDGEEIKELIQSKLRNIDKLYLISCGEFEDLIPTRLLLNAVNFIHNTEYSCNLDDFLYSESSVQNLEEIYRKYGFGEFKKAHFAQELKKYIESNCTKDDFKDSEINEIYKALQAI